MDPAEKRWNFQAVEMGLEGSCRCIKLGCHARILPRSCQGVSYWWPAAKISIVRPTWLCFIFLLKIIIWTYFWGAEAYTLEFVDSLLSLFFLHQASLSICISSHSLHGRHRVWRLWNSGQTDPEPRMSKDYPKVPSDFRPAVIYLFSVPCLYSLAFVGREESLGLYLQMCGI